MEKEPEDMKAPRKINKNSQRGDSYQSYSKNKGGRAWNRILFWDTAQNWAEIWPNIK